MANTTYVSPVINTPAKKVAAYAALSVLIAHIQAGTGGYTMDLLSAVFDQVTRIITIVLTNPLPSQVQIDRYNLTLV